MTGVVGSAPVRPVRSTLFLSDNPIIFSALTDYLSTKRWKFEFACSPGSGLCRQIDIRQVDPILAEFDLVISAHCKQIFPEALVRGVPCVNLHPGFNPDTRGWYPQSFALAHGLKIGFTVHFMDEEVDHGPIIYREEIAALPDDTSQSLYNRVLAAEAGSFDKWLPGLMASRAESFAPEGEGNYHSRSDFRTLCALDLDQVGTFREFYDLLRATSFPPFRNAWFHDRDGRKVFVRLEIERE